MPISKNLKASLLAAGLLVFSASQAADSPMSRTDYSAQKDRIEAQHKSARNACDSLNGNAKDICVEDAKGKQKVALAELDQKRSGKDADMRKVTEARADAQYQVAKERCDDLSGNAKDVCMKDAKAAQTQAKESAKATSKTNEARKEAREETGDARYAAARERCDSMSGQAKDNCLAAAKSQYGKN